MSTSPTFARDVETGMAMMGSGTASGMIGTEAARRPFQSVARGHQLVGAQGILVTSPRHGPVIGEFQEVATSSSSSRPTMPPWWWHVIDRRTSQIRVTVVATGLGKPVARAAPRPAEPLRTLRRSMR